MSDPSGSVGDPQFSLPHGLTLLGSEQGQSFSWVNGRSSNRIEYRYAIGTDEPGQFGVGPIRVRIGKQVFECPVLTLTVTNAAPRSLPAARSVAGASLVVEVRPQRPYVGQLVQLSMKLVQTQDLSESGGNTTPSTTGFWAEGLWRPDRVARHLGGTRGHRDRATRMRIYPLSPGPATIGSASLIVTPASSGSVIRSSEARPRGRWRSAAIPFEWRFGRSRRALRADSTMRSGSFTMPGGSIAGTRRRTRR